MITNQRELPAQDLAGGDAVDSFVDELIRHPLMIPTYPRDRPYLNRETLLLLIDQLWGQVKVMLYDEENTWRDPNKVLYDLVTFLAFLEPPPQPNSMIHPSSVLGAFGRRMVADARNHAHQDPLWFTVSEQQLINTIDAKWTVLRQGVRVTLDSSHNYEIVDRKALAIANYMAFLVKRRQRTRDTVR